MDAQHKDIFQRLLNGEAVPFNDPDYHKIVDACNETRKLLVQLNAASDPEEIRSLLGKISKVLPSVRMLLWRRERSCQKMFRRIQLLAVCPQKLLNQFNK